MSEVARMWLSVGGTGLGLSIVYAYTRVGLYRHSQRMAAKYGMPRRKITWRP